MNAPPSPTRRGLLRGALGLGAAVTAPTLLTGCGGPADAKDAPLKFWNLYAPQEQGDPAVKARSDWFVRLVDDWNATHRRQIELVFVPAAAYLGGSKLPTAFAAGSGPDIFMLSPGDFLRYQNAGVLADISAHMTQEAIDDFFPDALATRQDKGKVFALPMEIEPLAFYYNPAVWEKAGLSEGDLPRTWDEMLTVGDRLTTRQRAGIVLPTKGDYFQNFCWYPWLWQAGGEVVKDGQQAFDSPATRKALRLWQEGVASGVVPRTAPAAGDMQTGLQGGQAGMWLNTISSIADLRKNLPDFEFGVLRFPRPADGEEVTAMGGWAFAANAQGRDPDAAAEFIAFALGSTDRECVDRMNDWCTVTKSDIAPRRSVLEAGEKSGGYDHYAMRAFKEEIFPTGRAEPRYPPVLYKSVSDAIQATMLARRDVDEQAERAAQAIEAYLTTYEGASLI